MRLGNIFVVFFVDEINNLTLSKCITALNYGWEEISYNHYDPRWGMNPHDPQELYPESDDFLPNLFEQISGYSTFTAIAMLIIILVFLKKGGIKRN